MHHFILATHAAIQMKTLMVPIDIFQNRCMYQSKQFNTPQQPMSSIVVYCIRRHIHLKLYNVEWKISDGKNALSPGHNYSTKQPLHPQLLHQTTTTPTTTTPHNHYTTQPLHHTHSLLSCKLPTWTELHYVVDWPSSVQFSCCSCGSRSSLR